MKKQALLALSAGLALTASTVALATTQNGGNTFRSNSTSGTIVIGNSDQTGQQDQSASNQDQTGTTTSGPTKRKIATGGCAGKKKGNSNDTQNNSTDDSNSTQNS